MQALRVAKYQQFINDDQWKLLKPLLPEPKKNPKADLEQIRGTFLAGGLLISMVIIYLLVNLKFYDVKASELGQLVVDEMEEEIIPITRQELQKPVTPPKPQKVILELNIVEDDVELEDEFEIEDFEASQDDEIEVIAMEEEAEEEAEVFFIVEDMPTFQGGSLENFRNYIQESIDYPAIAMENGISGTVYVNFVVNTTGAITAINIVRGVDPSLDNEVTRALKAAP